jgi:hypothetical protein
MNRENASRMFVDLVHSGTSKWANWEPPVKVEVGDYGIVNKYTGQFERQGSIFGPEFRGYKLGLEDYYPEIAPVENDFLFTSHDAKKMEFSGGPGVSASGMADAAIQGKWRFGSKRGALLAMSRPCLKTLPYDFPFKKLVDLKLLANKAIVVNASICPSFALYLSQRNQDSVSLGVEAQVPLPHIPGLSAGGKAATKWSFDRASGYSRAACAKDYIFTPIYTLRINKPRFWTRLRDGVEQPPLEGEDVLADAEIPWEPLDHEAEGEEEEFDD